MQEVIVQNFRAKAGTAMRDAPEPGADEFLAAVAAARVILGPRMHLQAPPNLSDPDQQLRLLDAGIDDWGGVSPLTPDHVNPEKPWPTIEALAATTAARGKELRERLTIYPEFATRADPYLAGKMRAPVSALMGADGRAESGMSPRAGRVAGSGRPVEAAADRADLREGRRCGAARGRARGLRRLRCARRDARLARPNARRPPGSTRTSSTPSATAERHRPLRDDQALALFRAEGPALDALCAVADGLRAEAVGDDVTYVINRNLNFTNVCYVGCRFCAFAQRERDAESYTLTLEEVADRVEEAWDWGASEVCMQGGSTPISPAPSISTSSTP